MRQANLRRVRIRDVATHTPVIRFGMARFCPTCDLLHTGAACPKCDGQVSVDLREMMTARDRQPTHAPAGKLVFDITAACGEV